MKNEENDTEKKSKFIYDTVILLCNEFCDVVPGI